MTGDGSVQNLYRVESGFVKQFEGVSKPTTVLRSLLLRWQNVLWRDATTYTSYTWESVQRKTTLNEKWHLPLSLLLCETMA